MLDLFLSTVKICRISILTKYKYRQERGRIGRLSYRYLVAHPVLYFSTVAVLKSTKPRGE